jgi:hypothetical protein
MDSIIEQVKIKKITLEKIKLEAQRKRIQEKLNQIEKFCGNPVVNENKFLNSFMKNQLKSSLR